MNNWSKISASSWRETKKKHLRDELLRSALKLFEDRGVERVSVDDIAKEAGVAKGTFYLYFKSKDEIFREVIKTGMKDYANMVKAVVESTGDRLEQLSNMLETQLKFFDSHRSMIHFLISLRNRESLLFPEKLKKAFRKRALEGIEDILKTKNFQSPQKAGIYASAIYGMLLELMFEANASGRPFASILPSVMEIVRGGLLRK